MRIAVIGTGYVGLVTGTCLAESGHEVACVDVDEAKVARLGRGESPIYEPGLGELLGRNLAAGRLSFTTQLAKAASEARCIFLAVGTPQGVDGAADLSQLFAAVDALAPFLSAGQILIIKSTVPVGTNARLVERLHTLGRPSVPVASNPEFLKEGAAIQDFTKPDRVVVGVRDAAVAGVLHEVYAPFLRTEHPFLVMSPESAELTKYVANAMLATKISFINEMANLCELVGADVKEVHRGVCHDRRIGFAFMFPGVGYGGSCFPKDVRALIAACRQAGASSGLIEAVDEVNRSQKRVLFEKIRAYYAELAGLTLGVWGLAFKPCTDDIREAPALALIDLLLAEGVRLRVHDPVALDHVRALYGERLVYCRNAEEAARGADGLAVVTEWNEFRNPNFSYLRRIMSRPVIFDGRNLYDPQALAALGFAYRYIGQPTGPGRGQHAARAA